MPPFSEGRGHGTTGSARQGGIQLRYTAGMPSVADALRAQTAARLQAMSVAERIALALALGDQDLERFVRASGLPREEALRRLRAGRQRGRAHSRCAAGDHP